MEETATHYIGTLLRENVNEFSSRIHLVHGLGLCPEHTWRLFYAEIPKYGDYGGISIIYADLVRRVIRGVQDFQAEFRPGKGSRQLGIFTRLWAALNSKPPVREPSHPEGLWPTASCRACQHVAEVEANHLHWFVSACTRPSFRARHTESHGLCRKHLAAALENAARRSPEVGQFLADTAVATLSALAHNLDEYDRKRAWANRFEQRTPEETAPRRATLFFGGPEPALVKDAAKATAMGPESDPISRSL